jgi:hypothetical protein
LGIYANAQSADILYYLPDSVEIKVNEYTAKQKMGTKFYCMLRFVGADTFNISVCQYNEKDKKYLERWIFVSNRKVIVNKFKYPLVLDYDYKFSTINSSRVGVYGDRADKIVRIFPITHCFNLTFTKYYILSNGKPIGFANAQKKLD